MSKKKTTTTNPNYEAWKKIRGSWGAIKPIMRVIPNKKKGAKPKYPNKDIDQ